MKSNGMQCSSVRKGSERNTVEEELQCSITQGSSAGKRYGRNKVEEELQWNILQSGIGEKRYERNKVEKELQRNVMQHSREIKHRKSFNTTQRSVAVQERDMREIK